MKKLFSVMMMLLVALSLTLTGCARSDEELEADACPLVEQIIEENDEDNEIYSVSCDRLFDIKQIDYDHYTAIASVRINGSEELLDITITYDGDYVIVEIEE
jgi:hypothetical protein